jgi:DNA repair protein RecN (Recombination protein N)
LDDRCEVSARLIHDGTEVVVRRRVDETRSRAYIDDAAATASALADTLSGHIAIIGQHDQLTIASPVGVRDLIDRRLDDDGRAARAEYGEAWSSYRSLLDEREAVGTDLRAIERERDIASHEIAEIDAVGVTEDEAAELAIRVARLRNADALSIEVGGALAALGDEDVGGSLDRAIASLRRAVEMDPSLTSTLVDLEDLASLVNEHAGALARALTDLDTDPRALAATEERIAQFGALRRKYGDTPTEIIAYRASAVERLESLGQVLESAATLESRLADASARVRASGTTLRRARRAAADAIGAAARDQLVDLGFRDPFVTITVAEAEPGPQGADRSTVEFASDRSLAAAPVSAIASGGELSRLVLALSLGAGNPDASVLAFDEIDTGIGGTTALAMGEKLASLSAERQVICVTHLPQVAAFADTHVAVTRDGTEATVRVLDADGRVAELTRMLAGLSDSDKGKDHAVELLARASH